MGFVSAESGGCWGRYDCLRFGACAAVGWLFGVRWHPGSERLDMSLEAVALELKALDTFVGESGHAGEAEASLQIWKSEGPLSASGHLSARKMRVPNRVHGAQGPSV